MVNYKNGKPEDLREIFYDNGNLQQRGHYHNGNKDGIWEEFDVDGNLIYTELYKDGVFQY